MRLQTTKEFLKSYRKLPARDQERVDAALTRFLANPTDPALRDHALKGELKGLRAFSAGFDLRVLYFIEEHGEVVAVLVRTGKHNLVY